MAEGRFRFEIVFGFRIGTGIGTETLSTKYNDNIQHLVVWVDYRGSLSTVYNDGEISTCGWIIEVHSVQSTMMGRSQHVGRL